VQVPQQNGEECGIYVLYFIHCFLHSKKLAEVLENKKLDENFGQLVCHIVMHFHLHTILPIKCYANLFDLYE
jgi:Ulp1 family protease